MRVEDVINDLNTYADKEKAKVLQSFFKTGPGSLDLTQILLPNISSSIRVTPIGAHVDNTS